MDSTVFRVQSSSSIEYLAGVNTLTPTQWQRRRDACLARLRPAVEAHLARASRQEKHPVIDFLFQYYSFRPSQLMTWSPGVGVVLEGVDEFDRTQFGAAGGSSAARHCVPSDAEQSMFRDWMVQTSAGWQVDITPFPEKRLSGLDWVIQLLEALEDNVPRFGCSGLHEWAMVYKASGKQIRHYNLPLRLSADEIREVVEGQPIQCTHYDAFRFFMPEAKPLNRLQPEHSNRVAMEQSGCLHVNMDLYKWAYKYYPWIGSDRIADAFELAMDARAVDMRASPYDVRELGYDPIRIETTEGRGQYQQEQRRLQQEGSRLRIPLLEELKALRNALDLAPTS